MKLKSEMDKVSFESSYFHDDPVKILGHGAHGQVSQCYSKSDETRSFPFAVKIIRERDEERRMAHRKEFEITQSLDHINIVKSHKYFFNELTEDVHIVMDLVDGKEVLDTIAEQPEGHYTEDDAKFLFRQIIEGIAYLHS